MKGLLTIFTVYFLFLSVCQAIDDCSSNLDDPYQSYEVNIIGNQRTFRGPQDYISFLPLSFSAIIKTAVLDPNFRWLDNGGGGAIVALQSLYYSQSFQAYKKVPTGYRAPHADFFNTYGIPTFITGDPYVIRYVDKPIKKNISLKKQGGNFRILKEMPLIGLHQVTVTSIENVPLLVRQLQESEFNSYCHTLKSKTTYLYLYEQAIKTGQLIYLSGQRFGSISPTTLGFFDLTTDVYGAFTYEKNKIQMLIKLIRHTKPGGKILISYNDLTVKFASLHPVQPLSFSEYISKLNIPGFKFSTGADGSQISGDGVQITPQAGTLEGLIKLEENIKTIKITQNFAGKIPLFLYIMKKKAMPYIL